MTKRSFEQLEARVCTLAPDGEYFLHCGAAGAGHFTKMVHNGIEYGMMQAYAEGLEILQKSEFGMNLRDVSWVWGKGSVVRSWLQELLVLAFEEDGSKLENIKGYVQDSWRRPLDDSGRH